MVHENLIPSKSDELEIYSFAGNEFVIHNHMLGYRINVNEKTLNLLELVDGKRTIKEISNLYYGKESAETNSEIVYDLFYNKLAKYGIINSEHNLEFKKKASYLKLSFILLKQKHIAFFAGFLSPFINRRLFFPILTLLFLYVFSSVIYNFKLIIDQMDFLTVADWGVLFLIFGLFVLVHEFGHAASCKKFGARHGDIGFGFYLFTPVMYADVSDIWRLDKYNRIIVNLSGVYFDLIFATVLCTLFFLTNNTIFILISGIFVINTLKNLNPFLRNDGYWILSDLSGITNLREKSNKVLNQFLKKIFSGNDFLFSQKNTFLLFYALISMFFISFVVLVFFITDPNQFLAFPMEISTYVYSLYFDGRKFVFSDLYQFILPFIFYYIILKIFVVMLIKYGRSH